LGQQIPRNNLLPFYTEPKGRGHVEQRERPSTAGSAREISKFTNVDLINELRVRQMAQQADLIAKQEARRTDRPRSAPHRRPQEGAGPGGPTGPSWDAPTSRFGGFNQGSHAKSTVATKLNRAKKMADVYHQRECLSPHGRLRKKHSVRRHLLTPPRRPMFSVLSEEMRRNRGRSRSSSAGRTRGGQGESDYWTTPKDMHEGTFRV
jgi:hypothetical protein